MERSTLKSTNKIKWSKNDKRFEKITTDWLTFDKEILKYWH